MYLRSLNIIYDVLECRRARRNLTWIQTWNLWGSVRDSEARVSFSSSSGMIISGASRHRLHQKESIKTKLISKNRLEPHSSRPRIRIHGSSVANPGCLSRIPEIWSGLLIPDPDRDRLPIPDPGSRAQKGSWNRIGVRNIARQHKINADPNTRIRNRNLTG